jgi:ATP-dependent DNA ligase
VEPSILSARTRRQARSAIIRNGHKWTDRYPLIVEAALRNRNSSFVIDGEAVLLGVGTSRRQALD